MKISPGNGLAFRMERASIAVAGGAARLNHVHPVFMWGVFRRAPEFAEAGGAIQDARPGAGENVIEWGRIGGCVSVHV